VGFAEGLHRGGRGGPLSLDSPAAAG
jgi:hypothetical protein